MENTAQFQFSPGQHRNLNAKFNTVGGNPKPEAGGLHIADAVTRMQRQVGLVISEYKELVNEGIAPKDSLLIRDGVADVIVTIDGLYHRLGLEYPIQIHETANFGAVAEEQIRDVINGAVAGTDIALNLLEALGKNLEIYSQASANRADMPFPASILLQQVNLYANAVLVAMHTIGYALRFDLMEDQQTVFDSNMSKFTQDLEVAEQGVAKYAALNVPAEVFEAHADGEIFYVVKCTAPGKMVGADGGDYSPGKILKGVGFHKPKWTEVSDESKRRFAILFGEVEPEIEAGAEAPVAEADADLPSFGGGWALGDDMPYFEVTYALEGQEKTLRFYNIDEPILGRPGSVAELTEGPVKRYTNGDYIQIPNLNGDPIEVLVLSVYMHAAPVVEAPYVELSWKEGDSFETVRHYDFDMEIVCAEKPEAGQPVETFTQRVREIKVGQLAHTYTGPLEVLRLSEITGVVHHFPEPTAAEVTAAE